MKYCGALALSDDRREGVGFDDKESKKISGVSYVGKISDSAVAVVADSVWGAMEGRRVLNVTWDDGPNKDLNTAAVMASLKQAASKKSANLYRRWRSDESCGSAHFCGIRTCRSWHTRRWSRETARRTIQGTKCELWAPTQVPQDCRDSVATAIGLDPDQVKVNVTLMGGGFGRRLEHDYAVEAALVSKAINAPVKVIWTREDDMRFSTYRPASLHQLSATLDGSRNASCVDASHYLRRRSAGRKVSRLRMESIPICRMRRDRCTDCRTIRLIM